MDTYLQRWFCIDERTGTRFSVRIWFTDADGIAVFHSMRVRGIRSDGEEFRIELNGPEKVGAAWLKFERNVQLVKYLLRDDLEDSGTVPF